jgi:hypothetical protein
MEASSAAGGRRDHVARLSIYPVLLFFGQRGNAVVGVPELLARRHVRTIQVTGVAFRCRRELNCRPDNERRGKNSWNYLLHLRSPSRRFFDRMQQLQLEQLE